MSSNRIFSRVLTGLLPALLAFPFSATAQDGLEGYLQNRFPLTKFEKNRLVRAGIAVTVEVPGIGAITPSGGVAMGRSGALDLAFPNNYKNGTIHHDGKALFLTNSGIIRDLYAGERVFVLKIDIKDSNIVFNVQTCGRCDPNAPDPEHLPARANVTFQFGKQYLATASPSQVEEIISHVFSAGRPDGSFSNPSLQSAPAPTQPASQPHTPMAPIPPPPPPPDSPVQRASQSAPAAPVAPTAEIKIGQTTDQILAALGQPMQIFNLGPKVVYKYKSLKITFVNGKVSDIE